MIDSTSCAAMKEKKEQSIESLVKLNKNGH